MMAELEENENDPSNNQITTGATLYKVDDKCIFLTQAESYANRGKHFQRFTQLEFECIIELLPKETQKQKANKTNPEHSKAGRPSRPGFELGPGHPLYASHHGFVRMKMRTAMLGGCPAPTFPGNNPASVVTEDEWKSEMDYFAKYVMGFIVPWSKESEAEFTFDTCGLCTVIDEWNRQSAPLVNRQRFRMIDNFISKENRSSQNEIFSSQWRERCTDYWCDLFGAEGQSPSSLLRGGSKRQEMHDADDNDEKNCLDKEAASKIRRIILPDFINCNNTSGRETIRWYMPATGDL